MASSTENRSPDGGKKGKATRAKHYCMKFVKFLFSHIGLCVLVVAYSILGGFLFEWVEKPEERERCKEAQAEYEPVENKTLETIFNITTFMIREAQNQYEPPENETVYNITAFIRNDNSTNVTMVDMVDIADVLRAFRDEVLDIGYDGKDCQKMGEAGGPGFHWTFSGSLLFSVTVITTIGYGHVAPKTMWGQLLCIGYATLGIPLMLLWLANLGGAMADVFRFLYVKVCCCGFCRGKNKKEAKREESSDKNPDTAMLPQTPEPEKKKKEEKTTVPLWMTTVIIGGYIFGGSLLFGIWEGWKPIEAAYFCFVTMSTIGFGDLVPGKSIGNSADLTKAEDQWKMVWAAMYILFGMAIMSMCFSLMQEEAVAKLTWVAKKMGIIEDEDNKGTKNREESDQVQEA